MLKSPDRVTIKWNKYIPHDPTPRQLVALRSNAKELLFGGALGGGKSDFLLMCGLQYMDVPGTAAAIFRKSLTDLKLPGALLDRAQEWLQPFVRTARNRDRPVTYVPSEHTYKFDTVNPDGTPGVPSKLCFCYIGDANIRDRYQSAEFQTICFDEISQWETHGDYKFMTTRLRKNVCKEHGKKPDGSPNYVDGCPECILKKSVPTRLRAATNPGGLGGLWIKKRFQIIPDPEIYPDRRDALQALANDVRVPFVGTHPGRDFVPSYIEDNPFLDQTQYDEFLNELDPQMRSQLRDGNWEARSDARFKRADVKYYEIFDDMFKVGRTFRPFSDFMRIFATVDVAGTTKEGLVDQMVTSNPGVENYTVISLWGLTKNNDLYWLFMKKFRDELPEVVDSIVEEYVRFRPAYMKMEDNGLGLGVVQYARRLGIPVKAIHKGKDKLENSTAAQLLLRAGKVYLPINANWLEQCEDELFNWSGLPNEPDDVIDTFADAANDIGPILDTLDKEAAEKIALRINTIPRPITLNPGLKPGSAMANFTKKRPEPTQIRYESY